MIFVLKKVGKFLLYFFGALVVLFALLFIRGSHDENQSKKLLANEVKNLPSAPDCSESSREYTTGGLDTESTWSVNYSCTTTGKQAYDYITTKLSERGYHSEQDYSKGGPGIFYSFTYSSNKFIADYRFGGLNGRTYSLAQRDLLEQSPVNQIHLDLTRNNY